MSTIIRDVAILDLREISSEELSRLSHVENVRTVILSATNADAFMRVSRKDVRSHVVVEETETVVIGQVSVDVDFLSRLPDRAELVVIGQPFLDTTDTSLFLQKVRRLRVFGQILYSDPSVVGALLSRLVRLQGQLLPISCSGLRWVGKNLLDRERLMSLRGQAIVSIGPLTIAPTVSAKDILENITSLTQIGDIEGPEEAVCALLARCKRRVGTYQLLPEVIGVLETNLETQAELVRIQPLTH